MKLPFFSRKFLEALRSGASSGASRYGAESDWLASLSSGQPYIHESSYIVDPPPQLFSMGIKDSKNDAENAIRVHTWLKDLPPSTAMEERLWAYLAHVPFSGYMRSRWPVKNEGEVLRRYLFEGSSFGALARHGIARLWWADLTPVLVPSGLRVCG